jgi:hypothetical protein
VYGSSADIFSLGVVLLELLSKHQTGMERAREFDQLRQKHVLPSEVVASFPKLAELCWSMTYADPAKRPSAAKLVAQMRTSQDQFRDTVAEMLRESNVRNAELATENAAQKAEIKRLRAALAAAKRGEAPPL